LPMHGYEKIGRRVLMGLEAFVAFNAVGGGIYGMSGADGVLRELLRDTPFDSFFVPSLILAGIVGGSLLSAFVLLLVRHRHAGLASLGAGVILVGWIVAQVELIGLVSWMQPAMLIAGLLIVGIAAGLTRSNRPHDTHT
jgi:hypothetical protein